MSDDPKPFAKWSPALVLLRSAMAEVLPGWREDGVYIEDGDGTDRLTYYIRSGIWAFAYALRAEDLADPGFLRRQVAQFVWRVRREHMAAEDRARTIERETR